MKFSTVLVASAAIASTLVAGQSSTGTMRKHRRDVLRTLYSRQQYPDPGTAPTCQTGFDGRGPNGECLCGPGRVQTADGTNCVTPAVAGAFTTFELDGPQEISVGITISDKTTGPSEFLTANLCASIAISLGGDGFYLQASATTPGNNDCWAISQSGLFNDPEDSGIFTPSAARKLMARGVPATGSIGQAGGILGFSGLAAPGGTTGCLADFDTQNADGTCTCGDGRVNVPGTNNAQCQFTGSTLPQRRRTKRDTAFESVQW